MDDDLFLERLETLFDKSLADLRTFAEREARPFEDVRKRVAEWHCRSLFNLPQTTDQVNATPTEQIYNALRSTSETLESLYQIARLHSFFLVVNPQDPADDGFLGGTVLGREFWRGYRGCGVAGAKAFKALCVKTTEELAQSGQATPGPQAASSSQGDGISTQKRGPASSLKAEVYSTVRNAVRAASGIRNAEMKWTDHSKLRAYGIQLIGWPDGVPMQNPSSLSVAQNKAVLEAVKSRSMSFVPIAGPSGAQAAAIPSNQGDPLDNEDHEAAVDFSWACEEPPLECHALMLCLALHTVYQALSKLRPG
ncbi:hypothetical protein B0H21DRAFT_759281 [Amylocystis lapponica]|nr:hypothetical protein B0H21DRAFT_759281 [Amylocystis lapponica]